jgi:Lrp/AsnC family leucine-responsive transcriptional regulator
MAQETRLDDIDRTILMLLQEDGRMTNAALAEAVGLTPTPMLQRIKKLEQAGVIRRYMAVVDPVKVGRPIEAFVHVTLKDHTLPNHKRFLALASGLSEVLECHHLAGEEDFLLKVAMRDIAELESVILNKISASGLVGRLKTTLVFSSAKSMAPIVPATPSAEGVAR